MTVKEFITNCPTAEFCAIRIINMPIESEFTFWMGRCSSGSRFEHIGKCSVPDGITEEVVLNSTIKTLYPTYDEFDCALIGFEVSINGDGLL